jgi:hypothetical protein
MPNQTAMLTATMTKDGHEVKFGRKTKEALDERIAELAAEGYVLAK